MGIIVIILIGVVVWQQKRIDAKDVQITTLQDKRVSDTNLFTNGYTELSKEGIAASRDNANALNLVQKTLDTMVTNIQSILNKK